MEFAWPVKLYGHKKTDPVGSVYSVEKENYVLLALTVMMTLPLVTS